MMTFGAWLCRRRGGHDWLMGGRRPQRYGATKDMCVRCGIYRIVHGYECMCGSENCSPGGVEEL